jgi:hypothetical protein
MKVKIYIGQDGKYLFNITFCTTVLQLQAHGVKLSRFLWIMNLELLPSVTDVLPLFFALKFYKF